MFAPLGILGAVLMLYGVGEWGRWAYLGVFLSIPLSMLLWFLTFYPQDKLAGALAPGVVAVVAVESIFESLLISNAKKAADFESKN